MRKRLTADDLLTLGIENLFDQRHLPVYSQLLRNNPNTSRVTANAADLTASFRRPW